MPTRIPLSIYVLWHPSFTEGAALARDVCAWFGGSARDARAVGVGIPVHFRSAPWSGAMALRVEDEVATFEAGCDPRLGVVRRPVNLQDADHNVFVPLVDDNMVDDPSWRRDLIEIASAHARARSAAAIEAGAQRQPPFVHLVPVQVTPSWTRLPSVLTSIQTLFLRRWTDSPEEEQAERLGRWRPRLRRLLTQALVGLLRDWRSAALQRAPSGDTILPREVFLSHAKMDRALGPGVAEELRDVAAGYGQIEIFYDENDLPSATAWSGRLLDSAGAGAGFIAVLSDAYATRYSCRREVEQARTPRRVGGTRVWAVRPTVVAVTLSEAWSRLVPDLSTVPAIAWQKHRAPEILDQLFLEALVAEFQLLYACGLDEALKESVLADSMNLPVAYLSWTPDAASVLRLLRAQREEWKNGAVVAYPGHGFLPTEEADIALSLGPLVRFISYEKLSDVVARGRDGAAQWPSALDEIGTTPVLELARRPVIAFSAGDSDDLAARGYDAQGSFHVDAAVLRFCRALLEGQIRIAYGGMLGNRVETFTSLLHDIVTAMSVSLPCSTDPDPPTPIENYVVAPNWKNFDVARRASLTGLAKFIRVGEEALPGASDSAKVVALATALSEMRRIVAERTLATLALGGKRCGFRGIMPGVPEEILCAMERAVGTGNLAEPRPRDVRVMLVGEFGGVTRLMVAYVLERCNEVPEELTLTGQIARSPGVLAEREKAREAEARYAALRRCLEGLRAIAKLPDATPLPRLGLTVGTWKAMMTTGSPGYVRRLLKERVVPALHAGSDGGA